LEPCVPCHGLCQDLTGFAAGPTQDPWDPRMGCSKLSNQLSRAPGAPLPPSLGSGFQRLPRVVPPCCTSHKGCGHSPDPSPRGECKTWEPNTTLPRCAHGAKHSQPGRPPSFPGLSPVPCPLNPKPCVEAALSHQGALVRSEGFLPRQDGPSPPLLPGKGREASVASWRTVGQDGQCSLPSSTWPLCSSRLDSPSAGLWPRLPS